MLKHSQTLIQVVTAVISKLKNRSSAKRQNEAASAENLWQRYLVRSETRLNKTGEYDLALEDVQQALLLAKEQFGDEDWRLARCMDQMASAYGAQKNEAPVEGLLKQALSILKKTLGAKHTKYANTLNNLGLHYWRTERFAEAKPCFEEAIETYAAFAETENMSNAYNNLGLIAGTEGDYEQEIEHYLNAIDLFHTVEKPFAPSGIAIKESNLALAYSNCKRYDEAAAHMLSSIAHFRRTVDASHPHFEQAYANMAIIYGAMGRTEQQLRYSQLSADHGVKYCPHDRVEIADRCVGLAEYYWDADNFAEAERNFLNGRDLLVAEHGESSFEVAEATVRIAKFYLDYDQLDEAKRWCESAAITLSETVGEEHELAWSCRSIESSIQQRRSPEPEADLEST